MDDLAVGKSQKGSWVSSPYADFSFLTGLAYVGLFKTEVIRWHGPWRSLEAVEFATLAWVDWFNTRRLLEPIGYLPPAEYEARYYQQAAVA